MDFRSFEQLFDVADTKAFLERVAIVIVIVTVTVTVTATATVTGTVNETETEIVDSMGGMEGLRRTDNLVEETASEGSYRAEMIVQDLGA